MVEVEFLYEQQITKVQCNENEKMKEIFNKFMIKSNVDINSIYFLYSGEKISKEITLKEVMGEQKKKTIRILVYNIEKSKEKDIIK